jgi:hypothetical protein
MRVIVRKGDRKGSGRKDNATGHPVAINPVTGDHPESTGQPPVRERA